MKTDDLRFNQLINSDKISQNTINSIIQDNEGFIWFGSQDGLNRYDGSNFKIYKKNVTDPLSISNNYIYTLFEDHNYNLWIGTTFSGLVMYDKSMDNFKTFKSLEVLSNDFVASIVEDNNNNLWIGTFNNGLFKFNLLDKKLEKLNFSLSFDNKINHQNSISSLYFNSQCNQLLIGVWQGGLYLLNLENENYNRIFKNDPQKDNSLISNSIVTVYQDSDSFIWVGTQYGLNRIYTESNQIEKFVYDSNSENCISGNHITSICEDKSGNVWIGTVGDGLNQYNKYSRQITNFKTSQHSSNGVISDAINTLYFDRSEVLWIGTSGQGVFFLDCIQKKFFTITNNSIEHISSGKNNVRSIFVLDTNDIFIGTFTDGLYQYQKNKKNFIKHSKVNQSSVNCLILDSEGNLVVPNKDFGIGVINPNKNTFTFFKDIIENQDDMIFNMCLSKNDKNIILMGTKGNGIKIFDTKSKRVVKRKVFSDIPDFEIRFMFFDSENRFWVSSSNKGLICTRDVIYDVNQIIDSKFIKINCDNKVWVVCEDSQGDFWIGTGSEGLNKIDFKKNTITCYSEEHGLCNNCVYGILEDNNQNLWLSTSSGLSKFTKSSRSFKNYDASDGLSQKEFNEGAYYKYEDNTMYFGGTNGITYFHPDEIKDNPYIPNIVLTDFEIFNETVICSPDNLFLKENITYAKEINLTYRESVFSFRFAALIFNNPKKNQYAYKMDGFDKDWTYCGTRRRVTYTNLNPGDYIFRVKGSNNDGIWNEEGTSIKIHISPPYWKTWWFKGLGLLSLVAATGYSYRQRLEKLEKETKAQEEFSRKLIESQENERKRIAHELHDTLAHDVLISKNKALMALRHKDDKEGLEKTLEEISELASSTITDIRNISYDLHPHQLEKLGFTKTIKSIINEVAKSTNINFVFETDNVDEVLTKESEINLFRVIQESISNIIKHSKATEAMLKVSRFEDYLLITLIDNGKGFDVNSKEFAEARQGFGLSGIAERLKFMKGEAKIDSEINKGTTLKLKIPLKPE